MFVFVAYVSVLQGKTSVEQLAAPNSRHFYGAAALFAESTNKPLAVFLPPPLKRITCQRSSGDSAAPIPKDADRKTNRALMTFSVWVRLHRSVSESIAVFFFPLRLRPPHPPPPHTHTAHNLEKVTHYNQSVALMQGERRWLSVVAQQRRSEILSAHSDKATPTSSSKCALS